MMAIRIVNMTAASHESGTDHLIADEPLWSIRVPAIAPARENTMEASFMNILTATTARVAAKITTA